MKLFTRYNRINIIASVIIFLCGSVAFYFVLDHVLVTQLDRSLQTEQAEIIQYTKEHNLLPEIINTRDQRIYFLPVNVPVHEEKFLSHEGWNPLVKARERERELVFGIRLNEKNYKVAIIKSQEQNKDFLKLLVMIAAAMIAGILLAGYLINWLVLKRLWQPFYHSIRQIQDYNLQRQQFHLPATDIDEFNLLNTTLGAMAERVETDYRILKEFTGNAAHEMQTPLALVAANTESLIQDETVLKNHYQAIANIDNAAKRLSRLNQSLLLLAKIENRRFGLNEKVAWKTLLTQRLKDLEELVTAQQLQVTVNAIHSTTLFHQYLADMLLTNLLGNAIRYNSKGGSIIIALDENALVISNTSPLPALDPAKIFTRFYRHPETRTEGSGLGLSIVQQVCNEAGYTIHYQYTGNLHVFSVLFNGR